MAPTYTRRNRSELQSALQHSREEDLLRKAEMLSASPDPDSIFFNNTIRKSSPFGVLVLFHDRSEQENHMPEGTRCDDLVQIERLISRLQSYPHLGNDFYEEKRQAFLKEMNHLKHLSASTGNNHKERHRLETEVRNADIQKAWLEKENTDRLRRIRTIEDDIRKTELAIKTARESSNYTDAIQKAVEETGTLKLNLYEDTQRLKKINSEMDILKAEQALVNEAATPATARLQRQEAERLNTEHVSLTGRLHATMVKLKELEEKIRYMRENDGKSSEEQELTASLIRSKEHLAQAKNELDGGNKMIDNLDLRVQIIDGRLKALQDSENALPEEKENVRIAVLARAEELLNAWISSSHTLHRILKVDGVSAQDLVEALFFASGPMCASGCGACAYLDAANVSLDTLMLYNTEEEHAGFSHVEVFN